MKYVPPHLRAYTDAKEKQETEVEKAEKEKEKLEAKLEELELENESDTEGDDFEIVLNSVVVSQIHKNKDLRGELLGYYTKNSDPKTKKKKKKKNSSDNENENDDGDDDDEDENDEDDDDVVGNKKNKRSKEKNKKKNKNESKKLDIAEINQSFCVCNIEDICIDKITKITNKYQLSKQRHSELLNNLNLYFNKNKYEEEGEKYISEVNSYYDDYVNIMAELNFETTSFGFYININDIKKKEVLATLLLSSLINKNSFVLCFSEKYGKMIFSAYKIDVDVVFEIKNQIKNSTFNQFSDILNVELNKKGLTSRNILQKVPIRIKNFIANSIFLNMLKNKNKNFFSSMDYLNTLEVDTLEEHIHDTCRSLELLKNEQEKIMKYKKDVFKQLQTQKIYQEKKKLENEKNKIEHDHLDTNEDDVNIQNIFKSIPQPSLLFPYVLTMSNSLLNDNINNLCSHAIAKSYLYYKNSKQ